MHGEGGIALLVGCSSRGRAPGGRSGAARPAGGHPAVGVERPAAETGAGTGGDTGFPPARRAAGGGPGVVPAPPRRHCAARHAGRKTAPGSGAVHSRGRAGRRRSGGKTRGPWRQADSGGGARTFKTRRMTSSAVCGRARFRRARQRAACGRLNRSGYGIPVSGPVNFAVGGGGLRRPAEKPVAPPTAHALRHRFTPGVRPRPTRRRRRPGARPSSGAGHRQKARKTHGRGRRRGESRARCRKTSGPAAAGSSPRVRRKAGSRGGPRQVARHGRGRRAGVQRRRRRGGRRAAPSVSR